MCSEAYPPHALMSTPSISISRTGPLTLSAGGRAPLKILEEATACRFSSDRMTCLTAAPDLMTSLQRSSIACRCELQSGELERTAMDPRWRICLTCQSLPCPAWRPVIASPVYDGAVSYDEDKCVKKVAVACKKWGSVVQPWHTWSCSEERCGTARSMQTLSLLSLSVAEGCSSQLTVSAPATSSHTALSRCCPVDSGLRKSSMCQRARSVTYQEDHFLPNTRYFAHTMVATLAYRKIMHSSAETLL